MTVEKSIEMAALMGAASASQGDETSPIRLLSSHVLANVVPSIANVPTEF
jgi:hypothetical protein